MEEQKEKSRASSKMTGDVFTNTEININNIAKTKFLGYEEKFEGEGEILKIFYSTDNHEMASTKEGDSVKIILNQTPFYAESGGQIGDIGTIAKDGALIEISDTQKTADIFIHSGKVKKGTFKIGDTVYAKIDSERRLSIMRNHTATHLLQAALRGVLGAHVQQQGSLVAVDKLRFDFTHPQSITKEQLAKIESVVNSYILSCQNIDKQSMPLVEAKKNRRFSVFRREIRRDSARCFD